MTEQQGGDNPKWKPFLDVLPESLHNLVKPVLRDWDANINRRFQEIHDEYAPLKAFEPLVKGNVDFEYAEKAVILADQLQRDPAKTMAEINQAFNLGFITAEEAAKLQSNVSPDGGNEDFSDLGEDIFKHPKFKALEDILNQVQGQFEEQQTQTEQEQALAAFEQELDSLEKKAQEAKLPFHRLFVTALMSQGVDGDEAVKQYQETLAGTVEVPNVDANPSNQLPDAPPVMGQDGSGGAGTPATPVNFGDMKSSEVNDVIVQMLQQRAEQNNQ